MCPESDFLRADETRYILMQRLENSLKMNNFAEIHGTKRTNLSVLSDNRKEFFDKN